MVSAGGGGKAARYGVDEGINAESEGDAAPVRSLSVLVFDDNYIFEKAVSEGYAL